jgi:NADH-quinone oxidoreductase subunit J
MSTGGQLLFAITGLVALVTAILTVSQRSPLRAAVSLLVHVISLAGLYLTLHAHLLAAIQLLVYAGAVVVLFVFVIMLIGPGAMETVRDQRGLMVKMLGGATVVLVAGAIAAQVGEAAGTFQGMPGCPDGQAECQQFGGVDAVSHAIYVGAAIPFELVSILLLVAIVGAIAVARGHTDAEKKAKDPVELDPRPRSADPAAVDPSGETPAE